jgi:hypothetical protein
MAGSHHVLLDGGYGSFALTVVEEHIWNRRGPADWSWSSNLPHHVTVTDREVAVVRWDRPRAELLTRSSVENQIEAFYEYLSADRVKSSAYPDRILFFLRRRRKPLWPCPTSAPVPPARSPAAAQPPCGPAQARRLTLPAAAAQVAH